MKPEEIIIGAILTEKSLMAQKGDLSSAGNKPVYSFWVHPNANKNQIKGAVKAVFGLDPLSVRTVNLIGKKKMLWRKRQAINLPKRKKALVQFRSGEKIDILEIKK